MSEQASPEGAGADAVQAWVALVVGEALVDVIHRSDGGVSEAAGGSAANVAVGLARLERPVWFATAIADDRLGAIVAAYIGRDGVRLAADPETIERTSSAVASIGSDGAADYEFDLEWRLGEVTVPEGRPGWLHVCSIGAVLEPGSRDVLALARRERGGALVSYDLNARPAITGTGPAVRARVETLLAETDLVKASDEDLAALWPELAEPVAIERILSLGPRAVVVTRGAEGARWHDARTTVAAAAVAGVEVADTIGAGDSFAAALIDALWAAGVVGAGARDRLGSLGDAAIATVLEAAGRAAALAVTRPGADPPYRGELDRDAR